MDNTVLPLSDAEIESASQGCFDGPYIVGEFMNAEQRHFWKDGAKWMRSVVMRRMEQPEDAATEHQRWSRVRAIIMDLLSQAADKPKQYEVHSALAESTTNEILSHLDAMQ
jgi:hypothetical protein